MTYLGNSFIPPANKKGGLVRYTAFLCTTKDDDTIMSPSPRRRCTRETVTRQWETGDCWENFVQSLKSRCAHRLPKTTTRRVLDFLIKFTNQRKRKTFVACWLVVVSDSFPPIRWFVRPSRVIFPPNKEINKRRMISWGSSNETDSEWRLFRWVMMRSHNGWSKGFSSEQLVWLKKPYSTATIPCENYTLTNGKCCLVNILSFPQFRERF